jgi:hypothetical protein
MQHPFFFLPTTPNIGKYWGVSPAPWVGALPRGLLQKLVDTSFALDDVNQAAGRK